MLNVFFPGNLTVMINWKQDSCRPILSVNILVVDKSDSRFAVVQFFVHHSYDYRPNWTPQSYYYYQLVNLYIFIFSLGPCMGHRIQGSEGKRQSCLGKTQRT